MQPIKFLVLGALCAGFLSACGQQEQVEPLTIDPIYNKYGDASCAGGLYLDTNQRGQLTCVQQCFGGGRATVNSRNQRVCLPPPGGCPPGTSPAPQTAAAAVPPRCVPNDGGGDGGRQPTPNGRPTGTPTTGN